MCATCRVLAADARAPAPGMVERHVGGATEMPAKATDANPTQRPAGHKIGMLGAAEPCVRRMCCIWKLMWLYCPILSSIRIICIALTLPCHLHRPRSRHHPSSLSISIIVNRTTINITFKLNFIAIRKVLIIAISSALKQFSF